MNTPALIFDIDDTLYDQYTPLADACEEALGEPLPDKNLFFECFSRRSREMFLVSERGEVSIHQSRIYRIANTMKDLGIPFTDGQAETFQRLYAEKQQHLTLTAPIREMLDFCKSAGIPMGCVTNGPEGHQMRKFHTLGLEKWIPEEYLLVSGGVGCAKPDVRIFRMAEERMGLVPEETYMVGDSCENDMAGAFGAGWKAIWVNRHGKTWPAKMTAPDYTVHDDSELASLIKTLASSKSKSSFRDDNNMWTNLHNEGKIGSENGQITRDEEYKKSCRITLEKCPHHYAITCGIYGDMVHTAFCSEDNCRALYEQMKKELEVFLNSEPTKEETLEFYQKFTNKY